MPHIKQRKVTYRIDDIEWFRRDMTSHNPELTIQQIEDILSSMPSSFVAEYSLIGTEMPDRYELKVNGENWSVNDSRLNGYHKGCILSDCWRHFIGREHSKGDLLEGYPKDNVFGCIEIIETEVDG